MVHSGGLGAKTKFPQPCTVPVLKNGSPGNSPLDRRLILVLVTALLLATVGKADPLQGLNSFKSQYRAEGQESSSGIVYFS